MNSITKVALLLLALPSIAKAMTATVVESVPIYENYRVMNEVCTYESAIPVHRDSYVPPTGYILKGMITRYRYHDSPKLIEICRSDPEIHTRLIGYDVKFRTHDTVFVQRMQYDPGVGRTVQLNFIVR